MTFSARITIIETFGILLAMAATAGAAPQFWQKYDLDVDGFLNEAELQQLELANPELRGRVVFKTDDVNHDGRLSLAEMQAGASRTLSRSTHAEGTVTKTADGHTWDATLTGSNSNGREWTGEANGQVVRGDGTRTVTQESTVTRDDGTVVEREREATWTKTDNGWSIESEGSKTTDKGTSTFTGSADLTQNGDGTTTLNGQREGTLANGTEWNSSINGTGQRTENGRQFERTVDGQADNGRTWHRETDGSVTRDGNSFVRDSNSSIDRSRGTGTAAAREDVRTRDTETRTAVRDRADAGAGAGRSRSNERSSRTGTGRTGGSRR